jgi:hypothetical protein
VSTRYFSGVIGSVNAMLDELLDLTQVDGTAVLAACLGHGDIPWQRQDRSIGAMLEVGLCPTHGLRLTTPNTWCGLLDGTRNLLAPTPPRGRVEPIPVRRWQTG